MISFGFRTGVIVLLGVALAGPLEAQIGTLVDAGDDYTMILLAAAEHVDLDPDHVLAADPRAGRDHYLGDVFTAGADGARAYRARARVAESLGATMLEPEDVEDCGVACGLDRADRVLSFSEPEIAGDEARVTVVVRSPQTDPRLRWTVDEVATRLILDRDGPSGWRVAGWEWQRGT